MSNIRAKVEKEIMTARAHYSGHPSNQDLHRIRKLEEMVMLLADIIDRMNEKKDDKI